VKFKYFERQGVQKVRAVEGVQSVVSSQPGRSRRRLRLIGFQGGQRLGGKAFDLFLALWIMGNHEL
jgi:hypothetical protein